ncbi:MAG TPA: hypothetical protein VN493_24145 [Thermoanaerobaculia bacterium]|nr:hypothetical protein [Thermoanaerobaculia bacterium]
MLRLSFLADCLRACVPVCALVVSLGAAAPADAGPVTLLSRADPGRPSDTAGGFGEIAGLSADGRYTLFLTNADNLLPGVDDANAGRDLFLHDRVAGTTVLVSHAAGDPSTAGNGSSESAVLSANGRWAAFRSVATNLVPGQVDSPQTSDLFLYDRDTAAITLVSHQAGFPNTASGLVFFEPGISADGRRIAFLSSATNLVPGQVDGPASVLDAFLYDRVTGSMALVSHRRESVLNAAGNSFEVAISGDGNWVAFVSASDDIVNGQGDENFQSVFLYERSTGKNRMVSHAAGSPVTSANGDCFDLHVNINGDRTAYLSRATNLVSGQVDTNDFFDAFLYDRSSDANLLVSRTTSSATTAGNSHADALSLSANGRWVSFVSFSSNLVPGDTGPGFDVFLYDRSSMSNTLVSRSTSGTPANALSLDARISADGSWVVFRSQATNLVAGQADTPGSEDLFLWSRASGTVTLATHTPGSSSEASNGAVTGFRISADGSWIALATHASDLVSGVDDANAAPDLFLYEPASGGHLLLTPRGGEASETAGSAESPATAAEIAPLVTGAMSNDGRYVAFTSTAPNLIPVLDDRNNASDVFLHDRITGRTTLVSHAAGSPMTAAGASSYYPVMSSDGTAILFESEAADLVPGQEFGAARQLFVHDRITGEATLVTRSAASPTRPANGGIWGAGTYDVSGDGRWIAFNDSSVSLIPGQDDLNGGGDIFLFDRATGAVTLVSHSIFSIRQTANSFSGNLSLSEDGRFLAFTSNASDLVSGQTSAGGVFLHDRVTGTTVQASSSSFWGVALSGDGRWLAFSSSAANVVPGQVDTNNGPDVFLWDRLSGSTVLVSHTPASPTTAGRFRSDLGTPFNNPPVISADGRWVVFSSSSNNLVPGQVGGASDDIFLFDRVPGTVTLLSHAAGSPATEADSHSGEAVISADGRFVALLSYASNLIPGQMDGNGREDFFVHDRVAGTTILASHLPSSETATGEPSFFWVFPPAPRLSADGAWVSFISLSAGLVPGDHNGLTDAFLHANPLPGQDFFTVTPCRLLDTRQDGPVLTSGIERTVQVAGSCGVPATARAVAFNVTVIEPSAAGELTLYPGDLAAPLATTTSFAAEQIRSTNALLALALDGTGTLSLSPFLEEGGTVHVVLDLSGYFE